MVKFMVSLPINGCATVEVEAENEEEAIQKALDEGKYKLETWDVYERLTDGNVFNGEYDEAQAELIEED